VIDVFVRGTDGVLYEKTTTNGGGSWSYWISLGGFLTASPAAATTLDSSRIDVFVRGSDNGIWQKTYNNGGWGTWKSIGGI